MELRCYFYRSGFYEWSSPNNIYGKVKDIYPLSHSGIRIAPVGKRKYTFDADVLENWDLFADEKSGVKSF